MLSCLGTTVMSYTGLLYLEVVCAAGSTRTFFTWKNVTLTFLCVQLWDKHFSSARLSSGKLLNYYPWRNMPEHVSNGAI